MPQCTSTFQWDILWSSLKLGNGDNGCKSRASIQYRRGSYTVVEYSRSKQFPAASAADSSVAGSFQDTRAGPIGKPFIHYLQHKQCSRDKPSCSGHPFKPQEDRPHLQTSKRACDAEPVMPLEARPLANLSHVQARHSIVTTDGVWRLL
jgi:hypothetical protein